MRLSCLLPCNARIFKSLAHKTSQDAAEIGLDDVKHFLSVRYIKMSLFDAGILSRVSDILSRLTQRYSRQNSKPKQNTYHYLKSIKLM